MNRIKQNLSLSVLTLLVAAVCLGSACRAEKTGEGEMPDVNVEVSRGKLPSYEVDWAHITVGTRTKTIKVPKLQVVMEKEEIEVPYIDVNMPDSETVERTIAVEVEVPNDGYQIEIKEIYAVDNELWVISELQETGRVTGQKRLRISDRVVLNAPDLKVKHFIIASSPSIGHNEQYRFISSRNDIADKLRSAKKIYARSDMTTK